MLIKFSRQVSSEASVASESSRAGSVRGLEDADGQVGKEFEEQHHMLEHALNGLVSLESSEQKAVNQQMWRRSFFS